MTTLYNRTTSSEVRPGFQIPAWAIRIGTAFLIMAAYAMIEEFVGLFASGTIETVFWAIINELLPLIIIVGGLWIMFRGIIPKRRRQ